MATLDAAMTIGEQFGRFWRWWTGELRALVPRSILNWTSRMRVVPLVVAEDHGFGIHRFDGMTWQRVGKVGPGTAEEAAPKLGVALRRLGIAKFAVGLLPGQYLAKTVSVPLAAEANLRTALRYELDRHTPFKPEDVGFDCCILSRDEKSRELGVRLVTAPKVTIANAVAAVAGTGLLVVSVVPAFPDRGSLPINLLPHDESANGNLDLVKRWAPWGFLAALGALAIMIPIGQKRAQVIELQPQVNIAGQQAQVSDALHQQLDRALGEYNFLLQKRYATPTSLQLLNEVTRILPDDTWVQSFELRGTAKGREIQLQGETGVAGKLIELFEQSPLLTGASFKSPLTQAAGSQASRFHIAIDVREAQPPPAKEAVPQSASAAPGTTAPAGPVIAGSPAPAASPAALAPGSAPKGSAGSLPAPAVPAPSVGSANPGPTATGSSGDRPAGSNPSPANSSAAPSQPQAKGPEKPLSRGAPPVQNRPPAQGNTNTFNPGPAPF